MRTSFESKLYDKLRGGNYAHYMKIRREVEAAYNSLAYKTDFTQRWAVLMHRLKKVYGYEHPKRDLEEPRTDKPARSTALGAGVTLSRFATAQAVDALYEDVKQYGASGYPSIKRKYAALHQHYTGLQSFHSDWTRLLRRVDEKYGTQLCTANKKGMFE